MKNHKRLLIVTGLCMVLTGTLFTGLVEASPLWFNNYLEGKTTSVEESSPSKTSPVVPEEEVVEKEEPVDNNTKWWLSNDYWRKGNTTTVGSNTDSDNNNSSNTENNIDNNWSQPSSTYEDGEERILFNLLNEKRRERGLKPVTMNHELTKLARKKAKDMADYDYFSHTSPNYGKAIDMVRQADISHKVVGENIAITSSGRRANTLFMDSPSHRATMLNKLYDQVGIGIYKKSNGSLYIAEIFIGTN